MVQTPVTQPKAIESDEQLDQTVDSFIEAITKLEVYASVQTIIVFKEMALALYIMFESPLNLSPARWCEFRIEGYYGCRCS